MVEACSQKHQDAAALRMALWTALAGRDYLKLDLQALADDAGISHTDAILVAGSIERVLFSALQEIDDGVLAQSAIDFADDEGASMHEKLLEGLTQRFEAYADKRSALQSVANACLRHPSLGLMLAKNLESFVDRLLSLCGDNASGFMRNVRLKGVCGVFLKASIAWQRDDSPHLEKTLKTLDKDLKSGAEWAISLHVLLPEDGFVDERASDNGIAGGDGCDDQI